MISVDVPEQIGSENSIGPFTFSQLIRILFYSFPIIIFSIYVSIVFLPIILLPVILVWKKYNQYDLDIFLIKSISWKLNSKRRKRSTIIDLIDFKTNSRNATVWEYYEGYMCALESSGISIDFVEENEKKNIYEQFNKFLNSIDFGFSIYIYSYRDRKDMIIDQENKFLKIVAESQKNLFEYYNNRVFKKKFIIILTLKFNEFKINSQVNIKKASEILNERTELFVNSLSALNLKIKRLQFYEYSEIFNYLW
ncbi:MAG: hypothetical protein ACP5TO_01575 [Thermoplasmata archaeon]